MRFPLTLVYPSRRNLPPRVRVVIDFLNETIHANPAMKDGGDVRAISSSELLRPQTGQTSCFGGFVAPPHTIGKRRYKQIDNSGVLAHRLATV